MLSFYLLMRQAKELGMQYIKDIDNVPKDHFTKLVRIQGYDWTPSPRPPLSTRKSTQDKSDSGLATVPEGGAVGEEPMVVGMDAPLSLRYVKAVRNTGRDIKVRNYLDTLYEKYDYSPEYASSADEEF